MISATAVKRLLSRFGGTGTLQQKSVTYAPASGLGGVPVLTATTLTAVEASDRRAFAPESPFRTAVQVLYASCATAPLPGSLLDWGGTRYTVGPVECVSPNGSTVLMYIIALAAA